MRIVSEPNTHQHWFHKWKRSSKQQSVIGYYLRSEINEKIRLPCHITLTRIAPRSLDDDNLINSFKAVRDQCAAVILDDLRPGRADSDPRITWFYAQKKGKPKEYRVEIEITHP